MRSICSLSPVPYMFGLKEFDLLDDFFDVGFKDNSKWGLTSGFASDIKEDENSYVVEAELPGFEKEDISIEMEDGVLSISAERKAEGEDKKDGYVRKERYMGKVSRCYTFESVDEEQIKAKYDKGILTVTLPKVQKSVSKKGINID